MTYNAAAYTDELISVIRMKVLDEEDRFLPLLDALTELEMLLALRDLHPDAEMRAQLAISNLAAIWLDGDDLDDRARRWMT